MREDEHGDGDKGQEEEEESEDAPGGEGDAGDEGDRTRNIARICNKLSDLFGEPMEQSVIAQLIEDECGGVIKKEVLKGKNLYYFSDPKSPRREYAVDQKDVRDKVEEELWK